MTIQDYLDLIKSSLNIARSKAAKGELSAYLAGFHMGQMATYQMLASDTAVAAAAVEASTEIYGLFIEATRKSL